VIVPHNIAKCCIPSAANGISNQLFHPLPTPTERNPVFSLWAIAYRVMLIFARYSNPKSFMRIDIIKNDKKVGIAHLLLPLMLNVDA
jgi:hypothetical protein